MFYAEHYGASRINLTEQLIVESDESEDHIEGADWFCDRNYQIIIAVTFVGVCTIYARPYLIHGHETLLALDTEIC